MTSFNNHYSLEKWIEFHLGEIDSTRTERMKTHAETCQRCAEASRRAQAWLSAGSAIGQQEKDSQTDSSLWPELAGQLPERNPGTDLRLVYWRMPWPAAAIATALALFLSISNRDTPDDPNENLRIGLVDLIAESKSDPSEWIELSALRPAGATAELVSSSDRATHSEWDAVEDSDLEFSNWIGVAPENDWDLEATDESFLQEIEKRLRDWKAFPM